MFFVHLAVHELLQRVTQEARKGTGIVALRRVHYPHQESGKFLCSIQWFVDSQEAQEHYEKCHSIRRLGAYTRGAMETTAYLSGMEQVSSGTKWLPSS